MPDIPAFFNKLDFFGKLLPGYLAVTLFLILFRPELLFNPDPDQRVSFDLFSAVVFVVAGPAVGLTLQQLHRHAYAILNSIQPKEKQQKQKRFLRQYARLRLLCSDSEKVELDQTEADYDFSVSTGLALLFLGLYHILTVGVSVLILPILLFLLAIVFFVGGSFERGGSYTPMVRALMKKYPEARRQKP